MELPNVVPLQMFALCERFLFLWRMLRQSTCLRWIAKNAISCCCVRASTNEPMPVSQYQKTAWVVLTGPTKTYSTFVSCINYRLNTLRAVPKMGHWLSQKGHCTPILCHMLTDIQNSLAWDVCTKFVIKTSLGIPPHLKRVVTLPGENIWRISLASGPICCSVLYCFVSINNHVVLLSGWPLSGLQALWKSPTFHGTSACITVTHVVHILLSVLPGHCKWQTPFFVASSRKSVRWRQKG